MDTRAYDLHLMTYTALKKVERDYFVKCEDHISKLEDEFWKSDGLKFIEPNIIINIMESFDSQ